MENDENGPSENVFPMEHRDIPIAYVSLPEGNWPDWPYGFIRRPSSRRSMPWFLVTRGDIGSCEIPRPGTCFCFLLLGKGTHTHPLPANWFFLGEHMVI